MHRRVAVLLFAGSIATPAGAGRGDIPMMAIGMPFLPESPTPVAPSHPLFHDVNVGEVQDLPPTIKSSALNFIAAAKRSSVNAALRESFERMNMAATPPAAGRKRLVVTWGGQHTPFHIGTGNASSVTLHYVLTRADTGQILFERDITTSVSGGGAGASMRDNGTVRAAIATNFASAANCLDRAAYGTAPADCALIPRFRVTVVRKWQ